jgi:hypothetical protein
VDRHERRVGHELCRRREEGARVVEPLLQRARRRERGVSQTPLFIVWGQHRRQTLMLVEMAVCWSVLPIASATLMKRFEKMLSITGSGVEGGAGDMMRSWSGSGVGKGAEGGSLSARGRAGLKREGCSDGGGRRRDRGMRVLARLVAMVGPLAERILSLPIAVLGSTRRGRRPNGLTDRVVGSGRPSPRAQPAAAIAALAASQPSPRSLLLPMIADHSIRVNADRGGTFTGA